MGIFGIHDVELPRHHIKVSGSRQVVKSKIACHIKGFTTTFCGQSLKRTPPHPFATAEREMYVDIVAMHLKCLLRLCAQGRIINIYKQAVAIERNASCRHLCQIVRLDIIKNQLKAGCKCSTRPLSANVDSIIFSIVFYTALFAVPPCLPRANKRVQYYAHFLKAPTPPPHFFCANCLHFGGNWVLNNSVVSYLLFVLSSEKDYLSL